jgi:hypothetical protein
MVILGGFNGTSFGIDEDRKIVCTSIVTNHISVKFQFVHMVNRAPMLLKRSLYMQYLKHLDLSFAPFQCDDMELCLRAWISDLKVGWYNAGFKSLMSGGMRIWNNNLTAHQAVRNRSKLYEMYHRYANEITEKVKKANSNIE